MANELILYGNVGADLFGDEYFTAKTVRDNLKGRSGPLLVRLNSGGGIASEGQAIYTILKDYPGRVTVEVESVAASAASLIAMAGDHITMRLGAWMLIHDPASIYTNGRGTEADHDELARKLGKIAVQYASIYATRSGKTVEEARAIMRAETVLTGQEAVAAGFADELEGADAVPAAAFPYHLYAHAPAVLRRASDERLRSAGRSQKAVLAAIAGIPAYRERENSMLDNDTQVEPELSTTPTMTATQQTKLRAIASRAGIPQDATESILASATGFEAALDQISAAWKARGDEDIAMHGLTRTEQERYDAGRPIVALGEDWTGGAGLQSKQADALAALMAPAMGLTHEPTMGRQLMAEDVASTKLKMAQMANASRGYRPRNDADAIKVWMESASVSDYPLVAGAATELVVARSLEQAPIGLRECVHVITASDWRERNHWNLSGANVMKTVQEGGEPEFLTVDEAGEKIDSLTDKAGFYRGTDQLIRNAARNVDLEVALARSFRESAEETLRTVIAEKIMTPGNLADGTSVFHSTRNNDAPSAAAPDITALSAARSGLERQVDPKGVKKPVEPSIILVAPEQRTLAEQLVADITAAQVSEVNPFSGRLRVISDPGLPGDTGDHWYVLGDPSRFDGLALILLDDMQAPRIEAQPAWPKFGYEWRARWPMAASWVRPSWYRTEIA